MRSHLYIYWVDIVCACSGEWEKVGSLSVSVSLTPPLSLARSVCLSVRWGGSRHPMNTLCTRYTVPPDQPEPLTLFIGTHRVWLLSPSSGCCLQAPGGVVWSINWRLCEWCCVHGAPFRRQLLACAGNLDVDTKVKPSIALHWQVSTAWRYF